MEQLRNEVQQIFRDVFGDDQLVLRDEMTANDVDGWDSLNHLNLIIALEKQLGIKFATAEISHLKDDGQNVGSLLGMVKRKRA
jgi:acyl carrier protein